MKKLHLVFVIVPQAFSYIYVEMFIQIIGSVFKLGVLDRFKIVSFIQIDFYIIIVTSIMIICIYVQGWFLVFKGTRGKR